MPPDSRPRWLRSNSAPRLHYQAGPLEQSVRSLGKKWTLLLLRDMAFLHLSRFTEFLSNNPGLSPRVLSRRLKEMQREQLVVRSGTRKRVAYALTPRGEDAVYILLAFLQYGLKHRRGAAASIPARGRPARDRIGPPLPVDSHVRSPTTDGPPRGTSAAYLASLPSGPDRV